MTLTDFGQYDYIPNSVIMSRKRYIEGIERMISYRRLWETMRVKGVSQYALIKKYHVSPSQITRLKREESVSKHTIEMFCKILDCRVEDVMEYIPDKQ